MLKRPHHRGLWTPAEDAILTRMFKGGAYMQDVAKILGRSQEAVRTRANILGVAVRSAPRDVLQGQRLGLRIG